MKLTTYRVDEALQIEQNESFMNRFTDDVVSELLSCSFVKLHCTQKDQKACGCVEWMCLQTGNLLNVIHRQLGGCKGCVCMTCSQEDSSVQRGRFVQHVVHRHRVEFAHLSYNC
jgi:hypothetical protein